MRLTAALLATAWALAAADPSPPARLPLVVNTWGGPFTAATDAAWEVLSRPGGGTALDAVEAGCAACEAAQCDGTVGFGGSPDENCETTLDAMIMDSNAMRSGAVASLRRVRNAAGVARAVLDHTEHSLLAGDLATAFAVANGFREEQQQQQQQQEDGEIGIRSNSPGLSTPESRAACARWRDRMRCQPNFRANVSPDPARSCGPYAPLGPAQQTQTPLGPWSGEEEEEEERAERGQGQPFRRRSSHDTISMIAVDAAGRVAAGTSTNGAAHKVPGRVGDGAVAGSGAYADADGPGGGGGAACGATGDGDVMMRFLPCYQAVESVRRGGATPREAAEDAVRRILRRYPGAATGVVVVDAGTGAHGAAGSGWEFAYSWRGPGMGAAEVVAVPPLEAPGPGEL